MATFGDVKIKLEEQPESEGDTEDTEDDDDGMIKGRCYVPPGCPNKEQNNFGDEFESHFVVPHRLGNQPGELVEAVNDFHYAMINDRPRNEFYRECLRRAIVPGQSIVLEIGTGSGLLAMLAARLGAKKVVAIEASPHMAALATDPHATLYSRAFCQISHCSPSRNSFLSGRRPDATRMWDFAGDFRKAGPDWVTLPGYFKRHGYYTTSIGKVFHPNAPPDFDYPASWSDAPSMQSKPDCSPTPGFGAMGCEHQANASATIQCTVLTNLALHSIFTGPSRSTFLLGQSCLPIDSTLPVKRSFSGRRKQSASCALSSFVLLSIPEKKAASVSSGLQPL